MKVADVMTRQVVTIDKDAPIGTAARLLLEHRISGACPSSTERAISKASSPRAISCAAPRPAPSAAGRAGSNSSSAPAGSPRNTSTPTAAASPT